MAVMEVMELIGVIGGDGADKGDGGSSGDGSDRGDNGCESDRADDGEGADGGGGSGVPAVEGALEACRPLGANLFTGPLAVLLLWAEQILAQITLCSNMAGASLFPGLLTFLGSLT